MRVLMFASLAGLLGACGSLPWLTREPPAEDCGHLQGEIIWAGYGDPVALGVMVPESGVDEEGEIWVAEPVVPAGFRGDPGDLLPAFCYIGPPNELGPVIGGGNVPEGWEPP